MEERKLVAALINSGFKKNEKKREENSSVISLEYMDNSLSASV